MTAQQPEALRLVDLIDANLAGAGDAEISAELRRRHPCKEPSMTRDKIEILWQQAMTQAVKDGEMFTRYHFAKLVAAAEREQCAQMCELIDTSAFGTERPAPNDCAAAIRARSHA